MIIFKYVLAVPFVCIATKCAVIVKTTGPCVCIPLTFIDCFVQDISD